MSSRMPPSKSRQRLKNDKQAEEKHVERRPSKYSAAYLAGLLEIALLAGERIDPRVLAQYLQTEDRKIPQTIRNYIAGLLIQGVVKGRRRKHLGLSEQDMITRRWALRLLIIKHDELKRSGSSDPYMSAREKVANLVPTSPSELARWSKRRTTKKRNK
jgi:hypothetical protein